MIKDRGIWPRHNIRLATIRNIISNSAAVIGLDLFPRYGVSLRDASRAEQKPDCSGPAPAAPAQVLAQNFW